MTTRSLLVAAVGVTLLVGCGGEYEHRRLDRDSAEYRTIEAMAEALWSADESSLDDLIAGHLSPGLPDAQKKALSDGLKEFAASERIEMVKLDRFGSRLRASFKVTREGKTTTLGLMAIPVDDGQFRWLDIRR